jgi:hypothetical protein
MAPASAAGCLLSGNHQRAVGRALLGCTRRKVVGGRGHGKIEHARADGRRARCGKACRQPVGQRRGQGRLTVEVDHGASGSISNEMSAARTECVRAPTDT